MAKIAVVNFMTLDGVIQSPLYPDEDTDGGFSAGGWVSRNMDGVIARVMGEATMSAGGFLFGRHTYETFFSSWSTADQAEPAVAALNQRPKYVASTTLKSADWQNSHLLGPDVPASVANLKAQPGADILVFGSSGLLPTLIGADLIDAYTLLVFPLVAGHGKKMFPDGLPPVALTFLGSEVSTTGVVILRYGRP